MVVNLKGVTLPEGASVAIRIEVTAQANVTAFSARQKVNQYVKSEVSNQLRAESPDLSVGECLRWSVPVVLTSPARGVVGRVGEILVDATTGELIVDKDIQQGLADNAKRLAERSPL
jgi:hypothetical protein